MPEPPGATGYRCEEEACEALAAAAAAVAVADTASPVFSPSAASPSVTCSLRWRRSGAAGFLMTSGTDPAAVRWAPLTEPALDGALDQALDHALDHALDGAVDQRLDQPLDGALGRTAAGARLHRDLYRQRHDIGAIVQSRPVCCAALACLEEVQRDGVPAFHADFAAVGGTIRCAARSPAGSEARSTAVVAALESRSACLVADTGLLAVGTTLQDAAALSAEAEALARIYCQILQLPGGKAAGPGRERLQ